MASATLLAVTLAWPDWIELVFGLDPDRGSGSAEWAVAIVCACLTVITSTAAWYESRPEMISRKVPGSP